MERQEVDMADEIIDVEVEEAESVEPEKLRYVQFIFDAKMVEFQVPWKWREVDAMINAARADNGFFWVPFEGDDDDATGSFINVLECTTIKIVEREVPKPLDFPLSQETPDEPLVGGVDEQVAEPLDSDDTSIEMDFLTRIKGEYELPMFDGLVRSERKRFLEALLCEKFGCDRERAGEIIDEWRENN